MPKFALSGRSGRLRTAGSVCFLLLAVGTCCAAAEKKDGDTITLPPFTDTYRWHEFTLTKESPFSDDRRYRFVKVRKDGNVEVIDCAVSEIATKVVVVKPMPKKFKKGEPWPTMVVISADADRQIARLKELRTN